MRQLLLITTATVLGLATAGCDFLPFGQGGDTTVDESPVEESPVVVSPASPAASPSPGAPNFEQPTVVQENPPQGILPPDLISSTDPNQRVQQVKGNRNDPFALLPTTPTVQLPEGVTQPAPTVVVPTRPNGAPGGAQPRGAASPQPRTTASPRRTSPNAGRSETPNRVASPPGSPAPRSPITNPSPRPQPELARAVRVTGVVQVGDTVYAIVNAPNEPSSRYVQEGQRLANGQVLVRRIETNRAEPVVILEQFGVEVVRAVGEGGAPATPAASAPTAATPTS
jgi:hypothetical protein